MAFPNNNSTNDESGQRFQDKMDDLEIKKWGQINESYIKTIESARTSFQTNRYVNVAIFIVGVVLLANSVIFAWMVQDSDKIWSLVSGTVGAGAFFSTYFIKPQELIAKATAQLATLHMVFKNHSSEWEFIYLYYRDLFIAKGNKDQEFTPQEAENILELFEKLQKTTQKRIELIQKYVSLPTNKQNISESTENNTDDQIIKEKIEHVINNIDVLNNMPNKNEIITKLVDSIKKK